MKSVRALGDTDFYEGGRGHAMFAGQVYEVPDAEADRLISQELAEPFEESATADSGEGEEREGSPVSEPSTAVRRPTRKRAARNA